MSAFELTVSGVVLFPGGMMHPYTFRDMFGDEAFAELLAQPRVLTSYDVEEIDD